MNSLLPNLLGLGLVSFLLWVLVSIIFFLIIRQLVLWYFKIDENTVTLKRIADSLEKIAVASDFIASKIDQKDMDGNKNVEEKNKESVGFEVKKID